MNTSTTSSNPSTTSTSARVRPSVRLLACVVVLGALIGGCGGTPPEAPATETAKKAVTDANLAQKVQQATTPADHDAIARYYDERSSAAEQSAARERLARDTYERRWRPGDQPMGPRALEAYDHLMEGHSGEAREYRSLAEWHREMARSSRDTEE